MLKALEIGSLRKRNYARKTAEFHCGRIRPFGGGGGIFWRAVLQDVNKEGSVWLWG